MRKYADTENRGRNISASQVKTHASCPLQYWFRYVRGIEATKAESDYLTLGSRVHEAIEAALTARETLPFGQKSAMQASIQNAFVELGDEYPLPDDHHETGIDCCETAARYLCKRQPDIRDVEKEVRFEIDRPDIETGATAIMDLTTDTEIWDWKTGTIRDEAHHEEKIQGAVYMAAFYNEYGKPPENIRFVYIKEGRVRSIDPDDETWDYMLTHAKALLHAKQTGEFPADPGGQCYFCSYEYWCPEAPAGMGNVPWEEY